MSIYIKRVNGVQGFLPTTYAVFKGNELLKIVLSMKEAKALKEELEKNI